MIETENKAVYSYYKPLEGKNYIEKFTSCIAQIEETDANSIFKLNVFIEVSSNKEYINIKNEIDTWMIKNRPELSHRTTVIAQAPADNLTLAIEVITHVDTLNNHYVKTIGSYTYDVFCYPDYEMIVASSCCGQIDNSIEQQSTDAFQIAQKVLDAENLNFGDIVRQWNYIQNIIGFMDGKQNYQEFNNVRAAFYQTSSFKNGYPAATGIGQRYGGIIVDFFAIKTKKDIVFPIYNPQQIDAHKYSDKVLEGGESDSKSPKFERAKLLVTDNEYKIYVSGTAAIIGENTIASLEADEQVHVTFDNIEQLIQLKLLSSISGYKIENNKGFFSGLRVYVRKKEDIDLVKAVCQRKYPDVPMGFVEANVCRDNLYLEIEGEYILPR